VSTAAVTAVTVRIARQADVAVSAIDAAD